MEEMKKEVIEYPLNFHLDDKNDIYKDHIKETKEDLSDSDHGNEVILVTGQERAVFDGSNELLLKECPFKEDFEEISLKEEVSEEFAYREMSSSVTFDVLCSKSEKSLPNTSSEFLTLQQDHQEKEMKLHLSNNLKVIPQSSGIILSPLRALDYDRNRNTDVYSRSESLGKCAEYNSIPSSSAPTYSHALHHLRMNKKIYKCCSCPYKTPHRGVISTHLRTHTGEKPFKCSLCPYQSASKMNVNRHAFTHTGEKPFKCSLCPYQAATKAQLKYHSYSHTGEKPFKCSLCPYQAARKDNIKKHFITHTGDKPFKCNLCPYQAVTKGHLRIHSRTHTGEKPFKCSLCPYQASRKDNIEKHCITHTGDKPFKCRLCPYQAVTKDLLRIHSRTHTGEKPFKCSVCTYQAARKSQLNSHSCTHISKEPFKCSLCSYQDQRKDNFLAHLRTHTDDK